MKKESEYMQMNIFGLMFTVYKTNENEKKDAINKFFIVKYNND